MESPIVIVEYDPDWPAQFELIKARVSAAFGPQALAIEHIGSTSVPGLAAKPVIDIDVAVAAESDIQGAIRLLATLGYEHRGDRGIKGREAFWTPADAYPHHLYLVTADGRPFKRHMAFRDHMRADANAAREYAKLKRARAARFGADRLNYTEAKTEFIERILAEEPGPPD